MFKKKTPEKMNIHSLIVDATELNCFLEVYFGLPIVRLFKVLTIHV